MKAYMLFIFLAGLLSVSLAQNDIPDCVYDAFPELNQTQITRQSYYDNKGLVCDFCVQVGQDIQDILLDLSTEEAIAHVVENLCVSLIWGFEVCWKLVEACLPQAIEDFVANGLPPREFCELIFLCPE